MCGSIASSNERLSNTYDNAYRNMFTAYYQIKGNYKCTQEQVNTHDHLNAYKNAQLKTYDIMETKPHTKHIEIKHQKHLKTLPGYGEKPLLSATSPPAGVFFSKGSSWLYSTLTVMP